jgi:hypothetical protein
MFQWTSVADLGCLSRIQGSKKHWILGPGSGSATLQHGKKKNNVICSVVDPDPDPPDPHVFGPPGSGPDPQVRGMDPDPAPDSSIIMQK